MKLIFFYLFILQQLIAATDLTPSPASKMIQQHYTRGKIAQVSRDGGLITLTNGRKYAVHDPDRNISGGWLIPSEVKIYKTEDPNTFRLKNLTTNAVVRVSIYE